MPITAFEHLELPEQRKFFLDINKNQKPVDSDLLWDLSGDVPNEVEGKISNIAKFLNIEEGSPLFHRIYYPSTAIRSKRDKIKISAICIAVKKRKLVNNVTLQNIKNPLYSEDNLQCIKNVASSLVHYFAVLKIEFPSNWDLGSKGFVLTNGGISVMIGLFEKIITRVMQKERRIPNRDEFALYTKPLKSFLEDRDANDLRKLRLRITSEGGKSEVLNEFIFKIRSETKDDLFGGEIQAVRFQDEFRMLEKKLKDTVKKKLYNPKDKDWFKNAVDYSMYGRALHVMKRNGITDMKKIHLQIGLGDCFAIMRKHENLFYPIFINEDREFSFSNKTMLEHAFSIITTMRANLGAHYTGIKVKPHDEAILKIYLAPMNKCLDEVLR